MTAGTITRRSVSIWEKTTLLMRRSYQWFSGRGRRRCGGRRYPRRRRRSIGPMRTWISPMRTMMSYNGGVTLEISIKLEVIMLLLRPQERGDSIQLRCDLSRQGFRWEIGRCRRFHLPALALDVLLPTSRGFFERDWWVGLYVGWIGKRVYTVAEGEFEDECDWGEVVEWWDRLGWEFG